MGKEISMLSNIEIEKLKLISNKVSATEKDLLLY